MKYISNIVLIIVSIVLSLFFVELSLNYLWKNPFRDTRPSEIVELRLLSPSINKVLNREFLDKDIPFVKYRTNKVRKTRKISSPFTYVPARCRGEPYVRPRTNNAFVPMYDGRT
jgi:hypothetical protein